MDRKELIQALLASDDHNPNSLGKKLKNKGVQSLLARLLEGDIKEPRRATIQPVADHYGISVDVF